MSTRRRTTWGVAPVLLLVLAGCGSGDAPAAELDARLQAVDDAIVAGRLAVAREELGALGEETAGALEDGDLEEAQAERILDAVQALLEALPAGDTEAPVEEPTEAPSESDDADDSKDAEESEDSEDEVEETDPPKGPKGPKPPKGPKGGKGKGR